MVYICQEPALVGKFMPSNLFLQNNLTKRRTFPDSNEHPKKHPGHTVYFNKLKKLTHALWSETLIKVLVCKQTATISRCVIYMFDQIFRWNHQLFTDSFTAIFAHCSCDWHVKIASIFCTLPPSCVVVWASFQWKQLISKPPLFYSGHWFLGCISIMTL